MNAASPSPIRELRPRIVEKLARLKAAVPAAPAEYVTDLLDEIDAALERVDNGTYGICEACHDTIEADRLDQNPLVRFCLDHLTEAQRRAHEQDLELATQIQSRLLPPADLSAGNWRTHYRYEPAGLVGGDYCEIIASAERGSLFFAVGDVSGKGIAASLLMTHLSAIFRSLLSLELQLTELMARANRLLCESTPSSHYATLVAGRADESGVDLCNAGHCRPLVFRPDRTERIDSTGLPLGLFSDARYAVTHIALAPSDSLVLYSDGITETQDPGGNSYDEDRLIGCLGGPGEWDVRSRAENALRDVGRFRDGGPQQDDVTLLIVRRHS